MADDIEEKGRWEDEAEEGKEGEMEEGKEGEMWMELEEEGKKEEEVTAEEEEEWVEGKKDEEEKDGAEVGAGEAGPEDVMVGGERHAKKYGTPDTTETRTEEGTGAEGGRGGKGDGTGEEVEEGGALAKESAISGDCMPPPAPRLPSHSRRLGPGHDSTGTGPGGSNAWLLLARRVESELQRRLPATALAK